MRLPNHHFLVLHLGKQLTVLRGAVSLADHFAGDGSTQWHQRRHKESTVAFPSATAPSRRDDAITGDHENRPLEGRWEEAHMAVTTEEKETRRLLDELTDTAPHL
jgi:hypothetical protein